jgi:hypothetical protein
MTTEEFQHEKHYTSADDRDSGSSAGNN